MKSLRSRGAVVGVGISVDSARALMLRHGRVVWVHEVSIAPDEPLEAALQTLLEHVPRPRWTRVCAAVAVGPGRAQLRLLRDLPAARRERTLAAIVQQASHRYFLQSGTPLVTTPLKLVDAGVGWAGAIEAAVVDAALHACRSTGIRVTSVVPAAAVLGFATTDDSFAWRDGDVSLYLRYERGALRECRRTLEMPATASAEMGATLAAPLRTMGADAYRFADAYAAASGASTSPLALRHDGLAQRSEPPTVRLWVATTICLVMLLLLVVSPTIAAAHREQLASRYLASLHGRERTAYAVERQLLDSARLLEELTAFHRGAPSVTLLLASITRALESPTMLVSLRLDADGGTLVALTPSAAALLTMLAAVPEISTPTISGPVTPQSPSSLPLPGQPLMPGSGALTNAAAPDDKLQRVAVRFHWQGERRRLAPSRGGTAR